MKLPKKPLASKIVYENPWIKIHEDVTVNTAGEKGIYGYLESNDSIMVVAVNDKQEILLIHSFRYPTKTFGWELPGGGGDKQDLLHAAKRELHEETGYSAARWTKLGEAFVCNGFMTEKMAVFLAVKLKQSGHKQDSADEVIKDMHFYSLQDISKMIENGQINDCQTLAGIQYYQNWLQT